MGHVGLLFLRLRGHHHIGHVMPKSPERDFLIAASSLFFYHYFFCFLTYVLNDASLAGVCCCETSSVVDRLGLPSLIDRNSILIIF